MSKAADGCNVSSTCGGCPLIALPIDAQRERKLTWLRNCLQAQSVEFDRIGWVPSPRTTRYRNRIRMRVDDTGMPCFFNEQKSLSCAVMRRSVLEAVEGLQLAVDHAGLLRSVSHLEVRGRDADGRSSVFLVFSDRPEPKVAAELRTRLPDMLVGYRGMPRTEHPHQRYRVSSQAHTFVPLGSFLQINDEVNFALVDHVLQGAVERSVRTFLDLYAGAGNFAMALAASGPEGMAVEIDPVAVDKMGQAASAQGIRQWKGITGDSMQHASRWCHRGRVQDLVVVDPPRAGVREGLEEMAGCARTHLLMCSCHPKNLARDLGVLERIGMQVEQMTAFDMFPHTAHLEVAAWLRWR